MSDFGRMFQEILGALREPVDALFDPSRRVYGPFLLGAVLLAAVALTARGMALRNVARELFSPRVWLHRSALADYRLIFARALLRAMTYGAWGVSMLGVAAFVMRALRLHAGVSSLHVAPLVVGAVYTLAAFVADDWSRYFTHRLMHRVPVLWEFHKVHHAAEVLTPLTLYRTHPVEALLNGATNALAVGVVTGVCAWAFGPSLHAWQLFGVDAIGFVWSLAGANLRHSHVWISYGPRVEGWLLSPAQHQIHHSRDARHFDRNFGTVLALWDRLAGSLYVTRAPETLAFGLPESERAPGHTVRSMLLDPFIAVARRIFTTETPAPSPSPRARAIPAMRVALASASLMTAGCTNDQFDRVALLQSFGRCTTQTYGEFQTAADALVTATGAYADTPNDANRAAARAAWERAIDIWQRAEMLRFGPTAAFDVLGGRGMREQIYAWPDVSRCLIDQQIVSRAYENGGVANLSTNARGLAAIEYLLFSTSTDNGCPATEAINAMGTWAALSADEVTRRKAAYARAAAQDVAARARALTAAWEPNGFLQQLTTAGRGSTLFVTQQSALSAVAEGPFHLDTDTKDLRLAAPAGVRNCTMMTCPDAMESQWADRGKRHLRNNIAGARLILEGCAAGGGLGFDDLLESAGAGSLATEMRNDLNAADAAINAIPGESLRQALANDRAAVVRAHDAVKALTDFLKMEFSATLQISSQRVEGDHD